MSVAQPKNIITYQLNLRLQKVTLNPRVPEKRRITKTQK
jgi:hypothetical protein